ncbi:proteasome regulatory particle subunit [Binucleata daphniae]
MDNLLEQERQARLTKNENEMNKIMSDIISLCKNDSEQLTYLRLLSKRKGQLHECLKNLIRNIIQQKQNTKEFIDFAKVLLQDIIEGKFYLEEERIIVTELLKNKYEENNQIQEASDVVFNVPVETFTICEKKKIMYQLEVLRLCVKNHEWMRCDLVSKRMRMGYFTETNDKEAEANFYFHMVGSALGQKNFEDASKHFKKLYDLNMEEQTRKVIFCTFFTILSKDSQTRNDLLDFCYNCKDNSNEFRKMIKCFRSEEIINKNYSDVLNNIDKTIESYKPEFVTAIIHHNFRVISNIFTKITFADLERIMNCEIEHCVSLICELVNKNKTSTRIDQENKIVYFGKEKEINVEKKIENVMDRIIKLNHMIQKENLKIGK